MVKRKKYRLIAGKRFKRGTLRFAHRDPQFKSVALPLVWIGGVEALLIIEHHFRYFL